jgi:hypothetical protein
MKLTSKEQALINKLRKEEQDKLPKKIGYAKENLYQVNDFPEVNWFISESEKQDIIENLTTNYIELSAPAGTIFDCYIDDGEESWYDQADGLFSGMDTKWATKYLTNIKTVKRKI